MLEKTNSFKRLTVEILESILNEHSAVSITDSHGDITYVNDKFCDICKYSKIDLLGKNHRILKSGSHDAAFYENMWGTISSGKIWRGEIQNKAKDGSFYWLKTIISPIFDEQEKISHYISIRTDITELKEIQQRLLDLERLSSIGKLASRISHDLKNPLAVIQNSNEAIKEMIKDKPESLERLLKHTDNAIARISHQIEDVLDLVRQNPLKLSQCDVNEIIHLAINTLNVPKSVIVNVNEKPLIIRCDPFQMEVVFTNLLQNAIESMVNKGIIDVNYLDKDDNTVIEVINSGPSIPEDILDTIFDPLFTTKQTGTGLGLVSVKTIIEHHGGQIYVKNNPTTFTILLPKNPENCNLQETLPI